MSKKNSSVNLKDVFKDSKDLSKVFQNFKSKLDKINKENLEKIIKNLISKYKTNFKGVGQPIRVALTGSKFGPGIYDIILSLDKVVVIDRIQIIK